jgi:hypothetical protein
LELETSDGAEIPASAAESPEQIIVFRSAGSEHLSIGSHHLRRQQIVDRHPVFANQPANSTSEGQATDTSLGHYPARDSEPEDMRFSIDVTQSRSALYSNSSGRSIYENGPHSGKINHQTIVTERTAAYVVPAATNRRQQIVRATEIDRGDDVGNARAPSDHARMFADACIPDLTGFVVANIRRLENLPVEQRAEGFDVYKGHGWRGVYSYSQGMSWFWVIQTSISQSHIRREINALILG